MSQPKKEYEYQVVEAVIIPQMVQHQGVTDFKEHPVYIHFLTKNSSVIKYLTKEEAEALSASLFQCLQELDRRAIDKTL